MSEYYFEGDPSTDSARRQLERLLQQPSTQSRWGWLAAVLAGGGTFALWHLVGRFRRRNQG